LADFGFAKELREKDLQENGTGVGTILYMAPQLIFEEKPIYSIKCDVWSIGVVMYYVVIVLTQVLFGTVPWNTNQTLKSFQMSLRKPVEFNPSTPITLRMKNLISKMLLFREEERINIKDVKVELDEMIESLSYSQ
jgi:serine/threonine protein kinase